MYPKLFLFPLISDSEITLLRRNSNHSDEILKIVEERKIEIIFESIWAQYPIGSLWSIISGSGHNRIIVPHHLPPVLWKKKPVGGFFATTKFNCLNHANPNIDAIVITFCGVWFRFWKFKSSIVAYVINGIVFIFYWSGNGSQRRKPYFQFFNLWNCFVELSAKCRQGVTTSKECWVRMNDSKWQWIPYSYNWNMFSRTHARNELMLSCARALRCKGKSLRRDAPACQLLLSGMFQSLPKASSLFIMMRGCIWQS